MKDEITFGLSKLFLKPAYRRPGVRHSTFESLRLGCSSQSIASGFLRLWDSLNFKKDKEFVGITVLFLDEKMEANFSGSSSTSRQNQKIDVGGRLIKGILRRSETVQPDFIFCTA
ncbi:hypothetical protein F2Q69_00028358 [Brassica cretica]|uniref:Uncharacterized protein n=1 Tax=Brassica cretica TaxID=69181 RepID=A0A8S9S4C3_BRACR|nr:hypothetical protein F2Q69_00028358 [Brassica cretica]